MVQAFDPRVGVARLVRGDHQGAAVGQLGARTKGDGGVGEFHRVVSGHVLHDAFRGADHGLPAGPGELQQRVGLVVRLREDGCLVENHVHVRASYSEGIDACADLVAIQGTVRRRHLERCGLEVDVRVGVGEVEGARKQPVLETERHLAQPDSTCGGVRVPDVALDRAEQAAPHRCCREGPCQRGHLDGITQQRPGPVGLDETHRGGIDARSAVGGGDGFVLPVLAGGGVGLFASAIVAACRALDDGVDGVAIASSARQRFEYQKGGAVGEHRAACVGVERPAVAVARQHHAVSPLIATPVGQLHGDATGHCQVAFPGTQRLNRQVHRQQRRGTAGQGRQRGAGEVEVVGQPGAEEMVGGQGEVLIRIPERGGVHDGAPIPFEVVAARREDSHSSRQLPGVVARVFTGQPETFV